MKLLISGLVLCSTVWLGFAQIQAPKKRVVTLQDCIQQALEHNLELSIERYNPQIALFNVGAGYSAYDPVFRFSGQHDYEKAGETLFQGSFTRPGLETDTDRFNSSLIGSTPLGTTYELLGQVSDLDGTRYSTNGLAMPYSSSQGSVSMGVVQPLLKDLWYNPNRLNILILKNRSKWSDLNLRRATIDIITRVELAYYALKAGHETVKVRERALELAERLLAENKKRVEVGALAPLDEKQAEAEAASRRADLISAQQNLAVLDNALKAAITEDFASLTDVMLEPADPLDAELQLFQLQDSWSKGLNQRPDFLQARLDVEQQGIQVKINRNDLYPQVDLRASGGYAGSTSEFSGVFGDVERREQPFYSFGGELSYPLGNRAARQNYKASKARHDATRLALKRLEQEIMIAIDNDIKLARANYERVGATRKAREYSEAALAAEQKKLESGKSTSFFVLQFQRDLTQAQFDEINALVQYKRTLAELARDEGSTLERRAIDFKVR